VQAFDRVFGEILKMQALGDGKSTIIPGITREMNRHNF